MGVGVGMGTGVGVGMGTGVGVGMGTGVGVGMGTGVGAGRGVGVDVGVGPRTVAVGRSVGCGVGRAVGVGVGMGTGVGCGVGGCVGAAVGTTGRAVRRGRSVGAGRGVSRPVAGTSVGPGASPPGSASPGSGVGLATLLLMSVCPSAPEPGSSHAAVPAVSRATAAATSRAGRRRSANAMIRDMGPSMLAQRWDGSVWSDPKSWRVGTVDSEPAMDRPTSDPIRTARDAIGRAALMLGRRPLLVASDFDGTVSVPQMDPWAATILPQAQRALRSLAAMEGVHVALLSGRTAADLSGRVRVGGADYLGNQGLERGRLGRRQRARSLEVVPHPTSEHAWAMARLLAREVPRSVRAPWLVVESKGPAVTFHYRGAPDVAAAGVRVARTVDVLDPDGDLVRFPGRRSLELRPPGAPAKGEAFRALLDDVRPAVAFMLGDDRTDAAAFRVLRAARDAGEIEGMAIAVGAGPVALEEAGPHADIMLGSPADAARFLALLTRALGRDRSTARVQP